MDSGFRRNYGEGSRWGESWSPICSRARKRGPGNHNRRAQRALDQRRWRANDTTPGKRRPAGSRSGPSAASSTPTTTTRARNTTCWRCFPIPRGASTWAMCATTPWATCVARYMRAKGHNVLHPMGWDAFGMPAENAAMQNGVHPRAWTYDNIAAMRGQLKSMGLSLDWTREFATCDPDYYAAAADAVPRLPRGRPRLAQEAKVNWDPVDQTVLANEQVIDGRGWRSGALVEQRELTQWFFKITDYTDDLLAALDRLDRWPEKVRLMQQNWIGRSEGLRVRFAFDRRRPPERLRRDRGLHHPPRHPVRRELHRARRPTIRSPRRSPAAEFRARGLHRRVPPRRHRARRRSRRPRSGASTPACRVVHPFRPDRAAGLRRELRR